MHITDVPSRVFAFSVSDDGMWIAAPIAVVLAGVALIAVALLTQRDHSAPTTEISQVSQVLHYVRRHTARGGFHPQANDATVSLPRLPRSHWAISNDQWRERDHPLDAPSLGRRSVHNPARTIVPSDWRPPIGTDRISLIDSVTVEVTEFRRLLRDGAV